MMVIQSNLPVWYHLFTFVHQVIPPKLTLLMSVAILLFWTDPNQN